MKFLMLFLFAIGFSSARASVPEHGLMSGQKQLTQLLSGALQTPIRSTELQTSMMATQGSTPITQQTETKSASFKKIAYFFGWPSCYAVSPCPPSYLYPAVHAVSCQTYGPGCRWSSFPGGVACSGYVNFGYYTQWVNLVYYCR